MSKQLRKMKEAAQQLGTSDQTLRLWANEFRVFMSSTAAPPPGVAREFNDVDLRLLAVVRDMRRIQRPTEEIHAELQRIIDTGDLPPLPEPPQSESEKTAYLANVREQWLAERSSLQRDIARLEKSLEDMQRRLDAEQSGRREDIERLSREVAEAKAELLLWRSGRLKPEE
jgi:DNA-binding transcriptional MerR regulator